MPAIVAEVGHGRLAARVWRLRKRSYIDTGARILTAARITQARTRAKTNPAKAPPHRWSRHVMQTSDALDLDAGIFESRSPAHIAAALKASAEHGKRRKGSAFQSAMSMLNFYINRAGHNLSAGRRGILERAKESLRVQFGRPAHGSARARH